MTDLGHGKKEVFNKNVDCVSYYLTQAGIFGEICTILNTTPQTIPSGSTFCKCTAFNTNGISSNITPDQLNNKIVLTIPGTYLIKGDFSALADSVNVVLEGAIFLNNVKQSNTVFTRKIGIMDDICNPGFNGVITVKNAPADLDLRIHHDKASDVDITIINANLSILYIGKAV